MQMRILSTDQRGLTLAKSKCILGAFHNPLRDQRGRLLHLLLPYRIQDFTLRVLAHEDLCRRFSITPCVRLGESRATCVLANASELYFSNRRLRQADLGIELQELHVVLSIGLLNGLRKILLLKFAKTLQIIDALAALFFISQLSLDLLQSYVRL